MRRPASKFTRPPRRVLFAVAAAALLAPATGAAFDCGETDPSCTFFVRAGAPQPSGPCAGRTSDQAFPTIRQGAAALVNGGEVVCVEAGTYIEGDVAPGSGGTPAFPVVLRAVGDVVLRPPGNADTDCATIPTTGILILGKQYVTVEGFTFEGYCDAGIQVRSNTQETVNSQGITLRGNRVTGTRLGRGIDVAGEGPMLVAGNYVADNQGSGISLQGCIRAPDLEPKCKRGTTTPITATIFDNESHANFSHGIFVRGASSTRIENNRSYDNGGGGLRVNASSDTLVFNNLLFGNQGDGIRVGAPDIGSEIEPLPPAGAVDTRIINNTIYGNGQWGIEIGEDNAGSPGAVLLNNIVQNNGLLTPDDIPGEIGVLNESGVATSSTCGYVAGFNLVRNASSDRNYGPSTPHNVYDIHSDARFVAPGDVEGFRLGVNSPAVDRGYESIDVVHISGSTQPSGAADTGRADLGYHYAANANGTPQIDSSIMPIYVRTSGDDANTLPTTPANALASIGHAARDFARAGVEVVVGPGTYREGQISARTTSPTGSYLLRADPSGRRSDQAPGNVRVQADCSGSPCDNAFLILNTCAVRLEGFQVTGAREAGILVGDGADDAVVAHNQVFDNLQRGIQVNNARRVRIFDNLVYDNGTPGVGGGIQLGGRCPVEDPLCTTAGSPAAEITFNTVVGNGVNGVLIGAGAGDSSGATFRFNISVDNGDNAIQVGNSATREMNLVGLVKGYNVIDSYSDAREVDANYDYFWPDLGEPLFVDASAARFELDTTGIAAIDRAEIVTARQVGLDVRSTRVDRQPDSGAADLGYHYPILDVDLVGDCNGNGIVTVAELVTAVNISLERRPLADCPAADADGDGRVEVNELILAVNNALLDT